MCVGCRTEEDLQDHSLKVANKMIAEGKVVYAHVDHDRKGEVDELYCPVCGLDAYTAEATIEDDQMVFDENDKMTCGMCGFVSNVDRDRVKVDELAFEKEFDNFEAYTDAINEHIEMKVDEWRNNRRN